MSYKEILFIILIIVVIVIFINNNKASQTTTQMPIQMPTQMPTQMPRQNGQATQMPRQNGQATQMPTQMPRQNGQATQMPTQMPRQMPRQNGQATQMPTQTGQMPLSLDKFPIQIRRILVEIGGNKPTEKQIASLEKAIREVVPNIKLLIDEVKNAKKDSKGQPEVSEEKLQLVMLMISTFMLSQGKYFKDEIGSDIGKSYGSMPQK